MNLQSFRNGELFCEDGCRMWFEELNYGYFPDERGGTE